MYKVFPKVYELLLYYDYKFKMNEKHKLRLNYLETVRKAKHLKTLLTFLIGSIKQIPKRKEVPDITFVV